MIFVQDKIVSKQIFEKEFVCNLNKCKGACCVEGEGGAPLEKKEINEIKNIFHVIKKNLTSKNLELIKKHGLFTALENGEIETPLNNGKECVYSFKENGLTKCAFEESYINGKTKFQKPISCHLYPIRVKKTKLFEKLEYEHWNICNSGCELGKRLKIPLFVFLKDSLIRKFGKSWYMDLISASKKLNKI